MLWISTDQGTHRPTPPPTNYLPQNGKFPFTLLSFCKKLSFMILNIGKWVYMYVYVYKYSCIGMENKKYLTDKRQNLCGLWVTMTCPCRSIDRRKGLALALDVDSGGSCPCVWTGTLWEPSGRCTQFCCEPKTALESVLKI